MSLSFSISALQPPPSPVLWLGVVPISIAIGKWLGDIFDLAVGPLLEGVECSTLFSIGGGLFGIAFYITLIVVS